MYHTISNIDKTINLQQYIDNRDGCKRVGLKSLTYTLGWYNLEYATVQVVNGQLYKVPSGYYSFDQLSEWLESARITLHVDETNGIATLTSQSNIKISTQLKNVLGLTKKTLNAGEIYVGEQPIDFAVYKNLYVHLEQLNTAGNYFNGVSSTILAVVPVENKSFGDITTVRFEHADYKLLKNGTIDELKLTIRDEDGKKINNNLSINCVLEII